MNTRLHAFESSEALEQTVLDLQEELTKVKGRLHFVERDTEVWTSRFDELLKELNRLRSDAINYVTANVCYSQPPELSVVMYCDRLRLLNEVIEFAEAIEERWSRSEWSRE